MINIKKMSLSELREYVLNNRNDEEAWAEYASRSRPNEVNIPADATEEYAAEILRKTIFEQGC